MPTRRVRRGAGTVQPGSRSPSLPSSSATGRSGESTRSRPVLPTFEPTWRALFAELEAGSVARAWESLRHALWWRDISETREEPAELGEVRAQREPEGLIGLWTCVASGQWEGRTGEFGVMTDWIGDLLPTFSFAREVLGLGGGTEVLPLIELARSAGPWFAHERRVFVSERPCELHLDEEERLHCPSGPALRYPDGYAIHAWHGVSVPAWAIEQPERITVRALTREPNIERRRALLEIAGYERLLDRVRRRRRRSVARGVARLSQRTPAQRGHRAPGRGTPRR